MMGGSSEVQKMLQYARTEKMWIFDPHYKWWYSPEEFERLHPAHKPVDEVFFARLQLRDPVAAVDTGFKYLAATQTKLNNFSKMVLDYYKKK